MHFAILVSFLCLTFILKVTNGCHNAYHGGYHGVESHKNEMQQVAPISLAERRKMLLQEHGLPNNIIDCAVKKLIKTTITPLKKVLSVRDVVEGNFPSSRNKRSFLGLKEVIAPPPKLNDLKSQCAEYGNLCSDVLECAHEHNLEIPQLSFLERTTPPTTITITSTVKTNLFDGIKFPGPLHLSAPPKLPGFPSFPKFPICNCKSLFCKLRCSTTLKKAIEA